MPATLARYYTLAELGAHRSGRLAAKWHILTYTAQREGGHPIMQRRAKVFMNNRSQAVRLPKEFQFNTDEVFIRKEGEDVILSPRPTDWGPYLDDGPIASVAFMENVEDLPVQEREG
jgi:antitoxin VapB